MNASAARLPCRTKAEAAAQSNQIVASWRVTASGRAWVAGAPFPDGGDIAMAAGIATCFGIDDPDIARTLRQIYRLTVSDLLRDETSLVGSMGNTAWNLGVADEAPRGVGLNAIAHYHELSTLPDPAPPGRSFWSILKGAVLGNGPRAEPAVGQSAVADTARTPAASPLPAIEAGWREVRSITAPGGAGRLLIVSDDKGLFGYIIYRWQNPTEPGAADGGGTGGGWWKTRGPASGFYQSANAAEADARRSAAWLSPG